MYLSQLDQRWASLKLGLSKLTVGRFGCTTTCISMLSDYFRCYRSPADLAAQSDLYTTEGHPAGGGLVIWDKLNKLFGVKLRFEKRLGGERTIEIRRSLKEKNLAVIFQVADGAHWLVGVRPSVMGNDYLCVDPLTGKKCYAKAKYRNITGSAHFSGTLK